MSDEAIRAAERAVQAEQSLEAKHALRLLQQRLGALPFPGELLTPEWEEVFETAPKPGIFFQPCPHAAQHRCAHYSPYIHDEAIVRPVPWSLEAIRRVEWTQRTNRLAREKGGPLRDVNLTGVFETKDGCTIGVAATFLDVKPGESLSLVSVEGIHSPCPAQTILTVRAIAPIAQLPLMRTGRSVTVRGQPQRINPLENFQVQTSIPVVSSSWSRPIHPFELGIPAMTTRIDATSRCTCGHSGANHGTPDRSDYLTGRCLPGCPCTEFRAAFPSPEGPGVTHALPAPIPRVRATSPNTENEDRALVRTTLGLPADALIVRCESCSTLTDLPHCRACGWENGPPPVEQVD